MGEVRNNYDGLSDPVFYGNYRCMVQGDDILIADMSGSVPVGITYRSVSAYESERFPVRGILKGQYGKGLRILEVGSGLSLFATAAAIGKHYVDVCDPIDYYQVGELLDLTSKTIQLSKSAQKLILELQLRAHIYNTSKFITHIKMTFDRAFYTGALRNDYDVILNAYATSMYDASIPSDAIYGLLRAQPRPGAEKIHEYYAT